tara:strand:+ start:2771 stop:3382 length:612 start_codon:yes stop_codon:yes gene_type:complete
MGQTTAGKEQRAEKRSSDLNQVTTTANKIKEKAVASGNKMYGGKVSSGIDKELENISGAVLRDGAGNIIRSTTTGKAILTSYGASLKYGKGGTSTAMGTGDPSGALTSVPISKEMLKRQNMVKGIAVGAASFAMPGIGATAMRMDASRALADAATPDAAFADYQATFKAKQEGKKPPKKRTLLESLSQGADAISSNIKTKLGQ